MTLLTEDQVRDRAKQILHFENDDNAFAGTGQLTSFNTLGKSFSQNPWKSNNNKPDGWYLPKNKNKPALILETKSSTKDLDDVAIPELQKNMSIVLKRYPNVMGIAYNGQDVRVFRNEDPGSDTFIEAQLSKTLENKDYYIKVFTDKPVDVNEIYTLTARINNALHFKFGIRNLYDRMIFTAGALVAVRYGAKLDPDDDYNVLQTSILSKLNKSLEPSLKQNLKLNNVIEVFRDIQTNFDPGQEAIKTFVNNINKISQSINSSHWRGEDVMAIFFNEFNKYKAKSDNGQVFTPQHIANFMYRLIDVSMDDSVLDATCGSGTFLTNSMSNMITEAGGPDAKKAKIIKQQKLYGIEFDKTIFALACANMMIHKDGKTNLNRVDAMTPEAAKWIHNISWLDPEGERDNDEYLIQNDNQLKPHHITKILMNPPYEHKYHPLDILNNVLDNVPQNTDAAILLPDFKLEKEGKKKVKHLLEHNRLTKIIKLPKETFNSEGVSVSIFIFETGQPTNPDDGIFTCEIAEDGLETVKNQGRQDIKHRWSAIEDFWVRTIKRCDTQADKSCQWITPDLKNYKQLSVPIPQKPFVIYDEDFMKTVMDYEMFKQNINSSKLQDALKQTVLYQSQVVENKQNIDIKIKKGVTNESIE